MGLGKHPFLSGCLGFQLEVLTEVQSKGRPPSRARRSTGAPRHGRTPRRRSRQRWSQRQCLRHEVRSRHGCRPWGCAKGAEDDMRRNLLMDRTDGVDMVFFDFSSRSTTRHSVCQTGLGHLESTECQTERRTLKSWMLAFNGQRRKQLIESINLP